MMPALALVAAYLIGAIPFGFLLVKWKTGFPGSEFSTRAMISARSFRRGSGCSTSGCMVFNLPLRRTIVMYLSRTDSGVKPGRFIRLLKAGKSREFREIQ